MVERHYRKMNEEVEIDLIELMWDLAMQWKAIVLCVILCAALFLPLMYVKEKNDYRNRLAKQEEIRAIVDSVTVESAEDETEVNVDTVIMKYKQLEQMKKAEKNTLTYLLDWENVRRLKQFYIVETQEADDLLIALDMNSAALSKKPVKAKMAKLYGISDPTNFNAFSTSTAGTVTDGTKAEYYVNVTLLEDTDKDAVCDIIEETFSNAKEMITDSAGLYTMRLISEEEDTLPDASVYNAQLDYKTQIDAKKKEIDDQTAIMTDEQRKEYEKATGVKLEPKELNEEEKELAAADFGLTEEDFALLEEEVRPPRLLRIKYIILGIFLGAFLYGGIYLLYRILRPRITSNMTVTDTLGTQNFGEVHVFKAAKGIGRLFQDERIWKLKNRKVGSKEEQMREISERLKLLHRKDEAVELFSVGSLSDDVSAIAKRIADDGGRNIDLFDARNDHSCELEQKLDLTSAVIFVLSYNCSTYAQTDHLIELCSVYHVNILGSMMIEA